MRIKIYFTPSKIQQKWFLLPPKYLQLISEQAYFILTLQIVSKLIYQQRLCTMLSGLKKKITPV